MATRAAIRLPRTVEALERVWRAIPFSWVLAQAATDGYPTLQEELDAREAESSER